MLEPGEVIQTGDEVDAFKNGNWTPAEIYGETVILGLFRRRINQPERTEMNEPRCTCAPSELRYVGHHLQGCPCHPASVAKEVWSDISTPTPTLEEMAREVVNLVLANHGLQPCVSLIGETPKDVGYVLALLQRLDKAKEEEKQRALITLRTFREALSAIAQPPRPIGSHAEYSEFARKTAREALDL